jgi:ethanolamine utilization cobalamin adenosyltransferase
MKAMQFFNINKIKARLKNERSITFLFDDDDNTEEVVKYFRKKHHKVKQITSYGMYTITKRWWQV